MGKPISVIVVTDGDKIAQKTVETAARNIGARCISASAGNPTPLTGEQLVYLIKQAAHEPVVVMLDDKGKHGMGAGETALAYLARHPDIRILGALAVASNTEFTQGTHVDLSVDCHGNLVDGPVNKLGQAIGCNGEALCGDTVEVLDELNLPVIIGIGDVGKMNYADHYAYGAPVTTKALQEIIKRSGYDGPRCH
ncbi:stage V sporulation protein AE [Desulfallas thermosapovorans]|uniref:Stage V sporulation protein AE n=1 Tax=Desulfallas thermosapovorans DSM 6562 TaxID=1121431 RepID=A0A5S4ZSF5_9FIRM|nr:stage V sporulation protein AE [Desulfallas thermosapovorans]TYO95588.1 stage V sporulation protein AE [Desulfallas thermosapovorans DSM 6562]